MSFYKNVELVNAVLPADKIDFHPPTGISVLIVGAGVGGLMSALECRRKGHNVQIIERNPEISSGGDFFTIGPYIIRHFQLYWPDLAEELNRINYEPWIAYHKITGERISGPEPATFVEMTYTHPDGTERTIPFHRQSRPKFMAALFTQLRSIGVDVKFGKRVVDYTENEAENKAGVILDDGSKLEADVVIAADGVGTRSNKLVAGTDIPSYPSGLSIVRTAFPVEMALEDPEVADRWPLIDGSRPICELWQGDDMSFLMSRYQDIMSWAMTHKDSAPSTDSWDHHVEVSKVLEFTSKIPGFPAVANKLIQKTPNDGIIDWKLLWRDPQEKWTSSLGRVVQVGDSAHTFLPSSGNGATQAMEDAISLATCLQIGGKSGIPWATKTHNKLRFQQVSCHQLNGFINHQYQNNSKLKVVVKRAMGKWARHDAEMYAYDNYGKALFHILSGTSFQNTNIPPGYIYRPWTIKEIMSRIDSGEVLDFEGNWS